MTWQLCIYCTIGRYFCGTLVKRNVGFNGKLCCRLHRALVVVTAIIIGVGAIGGAALDAAAAEPNDTPPFIRLDVDRTQEPGKMAVVLQIFLLMTILSLAPAILIMLTSFTRCVIVLSLLRRALGTMQMPPNQVIVGLALFLTFFIMTPVWQQVSIMLKQERTNKSLMTPSPWCDSRDSNTGRTADSARSPCGPSPRSSPAQPRRNCRAARPRSTRACGPARWA